MSFEYENPPKLISDLKKGNEKAYTYLVNYFHGSLFNYAFILTNDRDLSNDILQEVFFSIWKNRKKLGEDFSLKNYLYKSTYNKFINQYHKKRALSSLERAYAEALNETLEDHNLDDFKHKLDLINKNIDLLPKKCKQVLVLSKKEGMTNAEIADYMNITIKTVEGHITKAYKLLRKSLNQSMYRLFLLLFSRVPY